MSAPKADGITRTYHLCHSVRGPLLNWRKSDWKKACRYITKDDGSQFTADELKQAFLNELAQGHEVIPTCKCDNFDWKDGCQGHEKQAIP